RDTRVDARPAARPSCRARRAARRGGRVDGAVWAAAGDGRDDARGARPAGPRPRARARARRHPRRAGGRRRVIPFVVGPAHDVSALLAATAPRTLVVGARRTGDGALPAGRAEAIVVAGFFVNWASGLRLADTQSGFRVYPVAIFDEVPARRGGFVFETEVLLAAAARGWLVREVPVRSLPRVAARSRFRPVADGLAIGAYLA